MFQPPTTLTQTPTIDQMLEILRTGSEQARRELMDLLPHLRSDVRHELRTQLVELLRLELKPGRTEDSNSPESWSRSWQVSVLVAVTEEHPEARDLIQRFSDRTHEQNHWVRYWVLATAVGTSDQYDWARARSKDLRVDADEHLLIRCLCWALGAKHGDQPCEQALLWALEGGNTPFPVADTFVVAEWDDDDYNPHDTTAAALRALRAIPLLAAFDGVKKQVDDADFASHTWDALWVLGKFRNSPRAREASHTLARFAVTRRRDRRFYDMIGFAVRAMGLLGVPQTELLMEELGNPSPGVFVEAARALERLIGAEKALNAVLEAVTEHPAKLSRYADALRVMPRSEVVAALDKHLHCGNPEREQAARTLFVELGGQRAFDRIKERSQSLDQRRLFAEELDKRHREHMKLIALGDGVATWISVGMTVAVFILGLGATGIAIYMVAFGKNPNTLAELLFGASGVLFTALAKLRFNGHIVETAGARAAARLALFNAFQRRLQHVDLILSQRFLDGRQVEMGELRVFSDLVAKIQHETQQALLALLPKGKEPALTVATEQPTSTDATNAGASSTPPTGNA